MLFKLTDLFGIGIDKVIDSVDKVIDNNTFNKEEKAEFDLKLKELEYRIEELDKEELDKERAFYKDVLTLEVQDKGNARQAEIVSVQSDDQFVRRFRFYLAIATLITSVIIMLSILFILIPESKEHYAEMILVFILSNGVGNVISYYFSSSYSSALKNDVIKNISKK